MFFQPKFASALVVLVFCLITLIDVNGKAMLSPKQEVETVESSAIENICPNLQYGCDSGFCWSRCVIESSTSSLRRRNSSSSYSEFRMSTGCDGDKQCQTWAMGGSFRRPSTWRWQIDLNGSFGVAFSIKFKKRSHLFYTLNATVKIEKWNNKWGNKTIKNKNQNLVIFSLKMSFHYCSGSSFTFESIFLIHHSSEGHLPHFLMHELITKCIIRSVWQSTKD